MKDPPKDIGHLPKFERPDENFESFPKIQLKLSTESSLNLSGASLGKLSGDGGDLLGDGGDLLGDGGDLLGDEY